MAKGPSALHLGGVDEGRIPSRLHAQAKRPGPSCCLARVREAFSQVVDLWGPSQVRMRPAGRADARRACKAFGARRELIHRAACAALATAALARAEAGSSWSGWALFFSFESSVG